MGNSLLPPGKEPVALCTFEPQERRVWPYDPALESCQATEGASSSPVLAFSWGVRIRLAQSSSALPQPAMPVGPITRTLFTSREKM